jgi:hypothetical protein
VEEPLLLVERHAERREALVTPEDEQVLWAYRVTENFAKQNSSNVDRPLAELEARMVAYAKRLIADDPSLEPKR